MLESYRLTVFGALLAGAFGLNAPHASAAMKAPADIFTPHRALYQMELGSIAQGSNVANASGTMFYRFEPQCEGWEVESRVAMRLHYGTGGEAEVVETTWTYTSFESYDGTHFTYSVDHNRNGEIQEIFAGEAGKDSAGGMAAFDDVEATSVSLPSGTMFPAEHLIRLLAHARENTGNFKRVIFDGASIINPYEVNAYVIGQVEDAAVAEKGKGVKFPGSIKKPVLVGSSLPASTGASASKEARANVWRVRMAYFPYLDRDALPEFEIEVDYRDNGIAERMVQDFGDFTLNLTPSRIEVLPKLDCN